MAINPYRISSAKQGNNGLLTLTVSDTAGSSAPISTATAKAWLKVETSADDTLIGDLIDEVVDEIEHQFSIPLRSKDVVAVWDQFGAEVILPFAPVDSITSVVTVDGNGNSETLTVDEDYKLVGNKLAFDSVYLSEIPFNQTKLTVTYVSAYDTLPKGMVLGLKKAILDNYENRESVAGGMNIVKIPEGAKQKFKRYMRYT